MRTFIDRIDAGRLLASALSEYRGTAAIVTGLARGGVAVGFAVAEELDLPLQALVVRKIGAPRNPELAIGAVSETGVERLDPYIVQSTGATPDYIERAVAQEVAEARRRQQEYAVGPGLEALRGQTAMVVDDGIATGASALVAVRSVRDLGASDVVLATPVASTQAVHFLRAEVDNMVVLDTPEPFYAVGLYYEHFGQVTDAEVVHYLEVAQNHTEVQP